MDKRTEKNTSFQPDVDPLLLKNLIQKSDMLGLLHFAIYFIILTAFRGVVTFEIFFVFFIIRWTRLALVGKFGLFVTVFLAISE